MKLLAAQRNLANAERLGQTDRVKRLKSHVAQLEKATVLVEVLVETPAEEPVEETAPKKPAATKSKGK